MEDRKKRMKVGNEPVTGGTVMGLPFELSLRILLSSLPEGSRNKVEQMKQFRLVSREYNALITDILVEQYIQYLEEHLGTLTARISARWSEQPSEEEGVRLTALFNSISETSEELGFLTRKVTEKKEARQTIFKLSSIDAQTKLQLLKACAFDSEFLTLRAIAGQVANECKELTNVRKNEKPFYDPLAIPGPGGIGPYPRRPPLGPYPFGPGAPSVFGEPEPDHLPPPDWERDRNPPGFQDPTSPFHFPGPTPDPFNPMGGRHGGRGGGWQPRYL